MRLFTGLVAGKEMVASPWVPEAALADESGVVQPIFIWAALDCPGFFALWEVNTRQNTMILGQLTVDIKRPVTAGQPHTVIGWPIGRDGRKHQAGTAIYTGNGDVAAIGSATWVEVPESVWADLKQS